MSAYLRALGVAGALSCAAMSAHSAVVTAGPGGFDGGYATTITYENDNAVAKRGTTFNRDNPLNALGMEDGNFFEIGLGSSIDLTFGTLFDTDATIFEVTFGTVSNFPEAVQLSVGIGGNFFPVGLPISNADAQGGVTVPIGFGTFDTVRLTDVTVTSAATGGFDVDAVKVSPVPLPAGGVLLLGALGAAAVVRRRKA